VGMPPVLIHLQTAERNKLENLAHRPCTPQELDHSEGATNDCKYVSDRFLRQRTTALV
jgi:hypothetical protein